MSVTLSTDLIVDVMNAAPPASVRRATARLADLAAGWNSALAATAHSATSPFFATVSPLQVGFALPTEQPVQVRMDAAQTFGEATPAARQAFRGFEGMLLRNMLESMLPSADSGVYGDGLAGSIWRSMAADQFASLYAAQGGVGIASTLAKAEAIPGSSSASAQWPYFDVFEAKDFAS